MSFVLTCLSSALFAGGDQVTLVKNPETHEVKAFHRNRGSLSIFFLESKSTDACAAYKIKGEIVYVAWEDLICLEKDQVLTVELPIKRAQFKRRKELRNFARQQVTRYNKNRGQ